MYTSPWVRWISKYAVVKVTWLGMTRPPASVDSPLWWQGFAMAQPLRPTGERRIAATWAGLCRWIGERQRTGRRNCGVHKCLEQGSAPGHTLCAFQRLTTPRMRGWCPTSAVSRLQRQGFCPGGLVGPGTGRQPESRHCWRAGWPLASRKRISWGSEWTCPKFNAREASGPWQSWIQHASHAAVCAQNDTVQAQGPPPCGAHPKGEHRQTPKPLI